MVSEKRYKCSVKKEEQDRTSVILDLVRSKKHLLAVENALRLAFEESHCTRWPECGKTMHCGCLESTRRSLYEVVNLIHDLIALGHADMDQVVRYSLWFAKTRYELTPEGHPFSRFSSAGCGFRYLQETLSDLSHILTQHKPES